MSVAELKQELSRLTKVERLELLEEIWTSLENKEEIQSPPWHEEVLAERDATIASGEAKFIDWEKAKADIRRRTS